MNEPEISPPYLFNFEARYWYPERPGGGQWSEWQTEGDCAPGCEEREFAEFVELAKANDCRCECRLVAIREQIVKTITIEGSETGLP